MSAYMHTAKIAGGVLFVSERGGQKFSFLGGVRGRAKGLHGGVPPLSAPMHECGLRNAGNLTKYTEIAQMQLSSTECIFFAFWVQKLYHSKTQLTCKWTLQGKRNFEAKFQDSCVQVNEKDILAGNLAMFEMLEEVIDKAIFNSKF